MSYDDKTAAAALALSARGYRKTCRAVTDTLAALDVTDGQVVYALGHLFGTFRRIASEAGTPLDDVDFIWTTARDLAQRGPGRPS